MLRFEFSAALCVAFSALFVGVAVVAGAETEFPSQTLSSPAALVEFGSDVAVDGILAAALSPGEDLVRLFSYDLANETWIVGPTLAPNGAIELGSVVAVSGFTVFYVAVTQADGFPTLPVWELRAYRLLPSPQEVVVFSAQSATPSSLAVSGNTLIVAHGALFSTDAMAYIYELDGGSWVERRTFSGGSGLFSSFAAVATDGNWAVVSEPSAGPHGTVHVLARQSGGVWADWQTIEYQSVQPNVDFGRSLALEDGCLVVGMPFFDLIRSMPLADVGGFASFGLDSSGYWVLRQSVVPSSSTAGDLWGDEMALVGPHLVLGGSDVQSSSASPQGDVALFHRSGFDCSDGTWTDAARLRSQELVNAPSAPGEYGVAIAADPLTGILVADPLGSAGQGDGRVYAFSPEVWELFSDGFESGDTLGWSSAVP